MSKDKPNYYAIIPSSVRYDNSLSGSQKLFYGEITALSNKHGYCYASNSYFAELYGVSTSTVSLWVKSLKENNHVIVEYINEGKEVKQRNIYPIRKIERGYSENRKGVVNKSKEGWSENLKDNSTSINTTSKNNKEEYSETKVSFIPTLEEVKDYFNKNGYSLDVAERAYNMYNASVEDNPKRKYWRDSRDNVIKNWKLKMQSVWFKDENKATPKTKRNNGRERISILDQID